jgi:putative DNA-invertase from lambdoid prophage Rac
MRAALYARVSTVDQVTGSAQLDALRAHAEARGWTVVHEVAETGSGVSQRPGREEVLRLARARRVDRVLVWKLDRWGRNVADLISTLHELEELGVAFVSHTEGLDLSTAAGRALAGMLAVFAGFERDMLRERIALGMARSRERGTRSGKAIGRPATARARTEDVAELVAAGLTDGRIAKQLGMSRSSVRRVRVKPIASDDLADDRRGHVV